MVGLSHKKLNLTHFCGWTNFIGYKEIYNWNKSDTMLNIWKITYG